MIKKWLLRLFFNNMYVRGFGGRRFLLAVFQTRLLSLISFHPCHLFDVLKWSVCTHMWNYLQVTPLPSWLQSEASNVHLWEEAEGGGEFPCPGSHLEFALFDRSLIALFLKKLSFFFFSPFCSIFHGQMEEEKVLLWIKTVSRCYMVKILHF